MRITRKLLIPTLILIGVFILALIVYSSYRAAAQFTETEEQNLNAMRQTFFARL